MRIKCCCIIIFSLFSVCFAQNCDLPIDVGSDKQLFIDNKFIDSSTNITLTVNPPRRNGLNIQKEKPWESSAIGGGSVIQYQGICHYYYWAYELKSENKSAGHFCYAVSKDGVNWEKPNLQQVEWDGSKNNNMLDCDGGNVFIDPKADPNKRFQMLSFSGKKTDLENAGLYIYHSPDGIVWTKHPVRLYPFFPDGINQIVYDSDRDKYFAYFRQWFPRSAGDYFTSPIKPLRTVGMQILDDPMKPWPFDEKIPKFYLWGEDKIPTPSAEAEIAMSYDEKDPKDTDLYTGVIHKYKWAPKIWLAFPSPYKQFPDPPHKALNDGILDIQLAVSRDGITWTRYRTPYLRLGLKGTIDDSEGGLYMHPGMVRYQNEIYQYYTGVQQTHGLKEGMGIDFFKQYRCTQRIDGFVSADAPYNGGSFTTPAIIFEGSKLILNLDTSALGQAKVELLDENDCAIDGFKIEDADLIQGNYVDKVVSWNGSSDLSTFKEKTIKLRFVMKSTKLYSFQFSDN